MKSYYQNAPWMSWWLLNSTLGQIEFKFNCCGGQVYMSDYIIRSTIILPLYIF